MYAWCAFVLHVVKAGTPEVGLGASLLPASLHLSKNRENGMYRFKKTPP